MNAVRLQAEALMAREAFDRAAVGLALWSLGSCLSIAGGLAKAKQQGREEPRKAHGPDAPRFWVYAPHDWERERQLQKHKAYKDHWNTEVLQRK